MAPALPGPDLSAYKWLQTERGMEGRREKEKERGRASDISVHKNHLERLKHLLGPHPLRSWEVGTGNMCVAQAPRDVHAGPGPTL